MMNFFGKSAMLLLSMLLCLTAQLRSEELEYKYELGGMAGGCFYLGDANYSGMFKNMNIMGGVVWRYNFNPRMVLKANLAVARISGDTAGEDNKFPGGDVDFSRTLYDFGAQFEYNFFAYGTGGGYKRTHRFTPYIMGGAGVTFAPEPLESVFTPNFSLGAGVKYKLMPRLNLGCEISFRMTFSDKLDVTSPDYPLLEDPYDIKSSGMKNKDSYSFFSIFLTYDLSPKYRDCNN